ncbi:MAG TPA: hypothetical protein VFT60_04885 [Bryobacteraceae bacterium]|jgi:hypothetical protein|nr:hypothetical protein [Bryobacteraceae bacterium]
MEDFRLGPVERADWFSGKTAIDPRKRRRHEEHAESNEEPVDKVELSSEEKAAGEE